MPTTREESTADRQYDTRRYAHFETNDPYPYRLTRRGYYLLVSVVCAATIAAVLVYVNVAAVLA